MQNRVPEEATCAICGRHFDPTQTRGWCPNPACGEWQHPSFPIEEAPEEADHDDERGSGRQQSEEATTDNGVEVGVGGPKCPDCGHDLSGVQSDQLSRCPVCLYRLSPDSVETAVDHEPDREGVTECPNCGEDLSWMPSDKRTVCPGCRIDLDEFVDSPPEPPLDGPGGPPSTEPDESLDGADPAEAPIDLVDTIEPGFGPRLKGAGIETVGDLVGVDPEVLSAKIGVSPRRIEGWINGARSRLDVRQDEPADEGKGVADDETVIRRPKAELVFEVMGREISVANGQTVGSEIRSAMVEAGASKRDAVYVHRKHVRVDADDDEFLLTRLGENSLEVNGNPLEKGRRIPIRDGDEITFSDVVTVTVSIR